MKIDTVELGAGSYPDAPIEKEVKMKTVEVECSFKTYVEVPTDYDYDEMLKYIEENYDNFNLIEETDKINIEDII